MSSSRTMKPGYGLPQGARSRGGVRPSVPGRRAHHGAGGPGAGASRTCTGGGYQREPGIAAAPASRTVIRTSSKSPDPWAAFTMNPSPVIAGVLSPAVDLHLEVHLAVDLEDVAAD